ncbi:MAG: glycosyltransferase family 2 protein [Thermodesulfobacteriota bacterium]
MIDGKKVTVVMPAYNAEKTLRRTHASVMAQGVVDSVVIVDDASTDETVRLARDLPSTRLFVHEKNRGYGANQKTCYAQAMEEGADIVIMVHPDYQYTPRLIPAMAHLIASGLYHCVLGSRILGGKAMRSGMPKWKYAANRGLTFIQNRAYGSKISEFHTGYRAFSRELLSRLPLSGNSDGFVFDAEVLAQILWMGYDIAEVTCPTRYFPEASSIGFNESVRYGFGCLSVATRFFLCRHGLWHSRLFPGGGPDAA